MSFSIRIATIGDIQTIRQIACLTWPVAYGPILEAGQLSYMLNMMYDAAILQKQIAKEHHTFLLAESEEEVLGFAGFGPSEDPTIYKLHKLYVLPFRQKLGAGKQLLQAVENTLREKSVATLKLNVNKLNPAFHYYQKAGFTIATSVKEDIGAGFYMDDFILQKNL